MRQGRTGLRIRKRSFGERSRRLRSRRLAIEGWMRPGVRVHMCGL